MENFKIYNGGKCAECGLCSYACPSKINLANKITLGKSLNSIGGKNGQVI
jgi:electron transport complex protein RnfC